MFQPIHKHNSLFYSVDVNDKTTVVISPENFMK